MQRSPLSGSLTFPYSRPYPHSPGPSVLSVWRIQCCHQVCHTAFGDHPTLRPHLTSHWDPIQRHTACVYFRQAVWLGFISLTSFGSLWLHKASSCPWLIIVSPAMCLAEPRATSDQLTGIISSPTGQRAKRLGKNRAARGPRRQEVTLEVSWKQMWYRDT